MKILKKNIKLICSNPNCRYTEEHTIEKDESFGDGEVCPGCGADVYEELVDVVVYYPCGCEERFAADEGDDLDEILKNAKCKNC